MTLSLPRVGQTVKAMRDIILAKNIHVAVLSNTSPAVLPKGSMADVVAVSSNHIDLNCKADPASNGVHAWGLKIRVARVVWGVSFAGA